MNRPKIVFYSHDGFGLGHIRRNLAIASGFVASVPGSSGVLIAGNIPPALDLPGTVDLIKLPSIRKVSTGSWRSRALDVDQDTLRSIRGNIIQNVVLNIEPDAMVVDYTPTGVWGELKPSLKALKAAKPRTKIVLGLRDILDTPEATRQLWLQSQSYETLAEYYDRVFVYGCKEIFDPVEYYALGAGVAGKADYCGYVCTETSSQNDFDVRAQFAIEKDKKLVVVTGGGGLDAFPVMSACLEAFRHMDEIQQVHALLIAGPLMNRKQRNTLRNQARGLPITFLPYTFDMPANLGNADLVITMGGYNTLVEALRFGKRVLAIPRNGPSAEQRLRAKTFAEHGLIRWIAPESLSPQTLIQAIRDSLMAPPSGPRSFGENGITRVVERLAELLADEGNTQARQQPVASAAARDKPARALVESGSQRSSEVSPAAKLQPAERFSANNAQPEVGPELRNHHPDVNAKAAGPRIAVFTHDTFGLGHVRRCLHFIRALSEASPDSALLIVTGSPALHALGTLPSNADYVKIPTIAKTGTRQSRPPHLSVPIEDVKSLRQRLIYEAVTGFEPDVFLVDNFPLGSGRELLPLLDELRHCPTATVLGLRDILDRPDVVRKDWRRRGIYQILEDCYDRILVYGVREVLDIAKAYALSPSIEEKLRYCGYVTRVTTTDEAKLSAVRELGLTSPWVLATVGGGGDGLPLIEAFIQSISAMPHVSALVITGPLMSATDRAKLERLRAGCPRIVVREHVDNLPAYMAAADAIVTMGGYNTLAEIAALGRRAIVVPRTWRYGDHASRADVAEEFEQSMRAEAFAKAGIIRLLPPSALDPDALAQEIAAALEQPVVSGAPVFDVQGISRVTEELLDLAMTKKVPADCG